MSVFSLIHPASVFTHITITLIVIIIRNTIILNQIIGIIVPQRIMATEIMVVKIIIEINTGINILIHAVTITTSIKMLIHKALETGNDPNEKNAPVSLVATSLYRILANAFSVLLADKFQVAR